MFEKVRLFAQVYREKVAEVCGGQPLGLGQSCEFASRAKAVQIAQKYKGTLPIFTDWSKTFSTSPVSRVINAILDGKTIDQKDINDAQYFIGQGDYQSISVQEWKDMIDHYSSSI